MFLGFSGAGTLLPSAFLLAGGDGAEMGVVTAESNGATTKNGCSC